MADYVVVDFLELDPKLFSLLDKRENGFGGYSVGIRYCGKKLYVKYGKRQCSRGVVKWASRKSSNYTVAINLKEEDPYFDKANELDSFFMEKFGSIWRPIVKGSIQYMMDFKIPVLRECIETKFFGEVCSSLIDDSVPKMSNIRVLALWSNVSIRSSYGAVVKPKAMQIFVSDIPKVDVNDDDDSYIDFPEPESDSDDDDLVDCLC